MEAAARLVRAHLEDIMAWAGTQATSGLPEAPNGLFQAAQRKALGYGRFATIHTGIFLIAGKLDFSKVNPYRAD
jgi:transposase